SPEAEVSGLAWYGDDLIILPQYPGRFSGEDAGYLFSVSKQDILSFLDGQCEEPLFPRRIPFWSGDIPRSVEGFQGYEAIAFRGHRAFLTIEAETGEGMVGYVIAGSMENHMKAFRLDPASLVEIPVQSPIPNMAYETLVVAGDRVAAIYEANGENINPEPVAKIFDLSLKLLPPWPLAAIEYRVTDATGLDESGRFWAINYRWPGETELNSLRDPVLETYGQGPTHARTDAVERLVEFQVSDSAVTLVDRAPIQLALRADGAPRNWEGIVRLEQRGFLLATDEYPEAILAFVPLPDTE
ncbi:MAG: hypothetical protein ACE5GH_01405, partial [Fidelibacterota bacterium]